VAECYSKSKFPRHYGDPPSKPISAKVRFEASRFGAEVGEVHAAPDMTGV
jgi:hypothetical protein